ASGYRRHLQGAANACYRGLPDEQLPPASSQRLDEAIEVGVRVGARTPPHRSMRERASAKPFFDSSSRWARAEPLPSTAGSNHRTSTASCFAYEIERASTFVVARAARDNQQPDSLRGHDSGF